MGKKATTIDEQIKLLQNRGMNFDCSISKAKEILLDIGFYRLGFYWHPFEIDEDHNFKAGINFMTVVNLYYLDVDLEHLLTKAINRIEINFRTQLIYNVSNAYPNDPTWFANSKVMYPDFVNNFPNYYTDKFKTNNKQILSHHRKYTNDIYAPAWKTLEFMTFGSIYTIYKSLKDKEIKKDIANHYGIKKVHIFTNFLKTIIFVRNICAHSSMLFDSNTPLEIETTPLINFHNNDRHSIGSCIKIILYFLNKISEKRRKIIEDEITNYLTQYEDDELIKDIVCNNSGHVKKNLKNLV